jgi:hypothetical protein
MATYCEPGATVALSEWAEAQLDVEMTRRQSGTEMAMDSHGRPPLALRIVHNPRCLASRVSINRTRF